MNKKTIIISTVFLASLAIVLTWIICQKIDQTNAKIVKQEQDADEFKKILGTKQEHHVLPPPVPVPAVVEGFAAFRKNSA